MNWDQIESNWKQLKGNIQQQWNRLTDDDLDAMDGKREGLSGKIQETYGINKVEADHQLDNWQSTQNDSVDLYNSDTKGDLDKDMNSLSNNTHTNNFGYDDIEDVGHNIAGNAPRSMQDGMGDNESVNTDSGSSNTSSPISVHQNSGSSSSVIQGSGSSSSSKLDAGNLGSGNPNAGNPTLGNPNAGNPGPGDGVGIPGSDESDDDLDDSGIPAPNPMPDDFDEPVRAHNHETPHEEKSLDQT